VPTGQGSGYIDGGTVVIINAGAEIVYDPRNEEVTRFVIVGGDISFGLDKAFLDNTMKEVFTKDKPQILNLTFPHMLRYRTILV
jgi:hypothetical protein